MALQLEYDLVEAASAGPIDKEVGAEIANIVADAATLDMVSLLAWGRAIHAAAAICLQRGDDDGELLHDMAQRLIGMAFDRWVLWAPPVPDEVVRH